MHQIQDTYDRISTNLHRKSQFCLSTFQTTLSTSLVWDSKTSTAAAPCECAPSHSEMQPALSVLILGEANFSS